jgi:hypothetical protein
MDGNQRTTGSTGRIHEDPDQPVGAGPAPAAAAKGAAAGGAVAALVGALLGAPFGFIEYLDLALPVRIGLCALLGAVAVSVIGGLVGGWAGLGAAHKDRD